MTSTAIVKNGSSGASNASPPEGARPSMPGVTLQQYIEARLQTEGKDRVSDAIKINDGSLAGHLQLTMALIGNLSGNRAEDFTLNSSDLTHERVEGLIKSYYAERGCEVREGLELRRNADLVAVAPDGLVQDINVSCMGDRAMVTVFKPEMRA